MRKATLREGSERRADPRIWIDEQRDGFQDSLHGRRSPGHGWTRRNICERPVHSRQSLRTPWQQECRFPDGQAEPSPALGSSPSMPGVLDSAPRPGVLLDRDGTIIVDHGYVASVDRVEFIDGAPEAIARLNEAHLPIAVVTNQAGVARGFYDIDEVAEVHRYMAEKLAEHGAHIDLFLYCPYHLDGVVEAFARASDDRKPGPGMANAAAAALNLDLRASWVVGDRPEDVGLATRIGASAIYLGPEPTHHPRVWSLPDLATAASFILERIAI